MSDNDFSNPPSESDDHFLEGLPTWARWLIAVNSIVLVVAGIALGYSLDWFNRPPTGEYENLIGGRLAWQEGAITFVDVYFNEAAYVAGIREGDQLLAINGEEIIGLNQAKRLIEANEAGQRIRVNVQYAPGRVEQYVVTLGVISIVEPPPPPRPTPRPPLPTPRPPRPVPPTPVPLPRQQNEAALGILYQMVGRDDPFGANGALIVAVDSSSPASQYGLEPGDIILEVDNISLENGLPLGDVLEDYREGESARLLILRDGREQSIRVMLAG